MTIVEAFSIAVQHHQGGRLAEAEAIYRQIVAAEPGHADALHLLGLIAHQVGRNEAAVEMMLQSIALRPAAPTFHSNLGEAYRGQGRLDEAIAAYGRAIQLEPDCAGLHYNLGNALRDQGQFQKAVEEFRRAIELKPDYVEAHSNLGNVLNHLGRIEEAVAVHRCAIELKPDCAEVHRNLGSALHAMGRIGEAVVAYQQAIVLDPASPEAYCNLGNAFTGKGRLDEAIAAYRQAIALRPAYPEAHNNLGVALNGNGQRDEAIAAYRQAIALQPTYSEAHSNLGNTFNGLGRMEEAITSCRQAIALKPDYAAAWNNLATALKDEGRIEDAVAAFRQARGLLPQSAEVHGNLLFTLHYLADADEGMIFREHRAWDEAQAAPLAKFIVPHVNDRDPERRLRVGYVSRDFREHSVAYFFEALLAAHDGSQVEVFCYSDSRRMDRVTDRLRGFAARWREIFGMADEQVAALIREDAIDILVDLAGHTAHNRLLVFARKVAPVQVNWLGYWDTTGMKAMDYRVTDVHADPPGMTEHLHSEELVRLPETFACFRPSADSPPVGPLPAMSAGHVTFGSFHKLAKLNDRMLGLWAAILQAVPGSRLLLVAVAMDEASTQRRIVEFFGRHGVTAGRLEFRGWQSEAGYLALHGEVDVLLDSHPFTGHTVSCHALWMGVPVVTLSGSTHYARMVTSVLSNIGHPEWIAGTPEEYVKIATGLVSDLPRLAQLRATLRERMKASPLMDAPRFARNMEAAYRQMWRAWCAKQCSNPES